jgi:hypothetical protein
MRLVCGLLLVSLFIPAARAAEFYVSPDGTPKGDGSKEKPWDLQTALGQPAAVKGGDTIWVAGGKYSRAWDGTSLFDSKLTGEEGKPIRVRVQPGQRATLDCAPVAKVNWSTLMIHGAWTWFEGLEVTDSNPQRSDTSRNTWTESSGKNSGVNVRGPHVKLINMVVHDVTSGIDFWQTSEDSELYGNIIYYCGWQGADRAHGHAIYTQNDKGTKTIAETIAFDSFGWGLHAYAGGNAYVRNYDIVGNVLFNGGAIRAEGRPTENLLIAGGGGGSKKNIRIDENFTYCAPALATSADKDYGGGTKLGWNWDYRNVSTTIRKNTFVGGAYPVELWSWDEITFTGNRVVAFPKALGAISLIAQNDQSAGKYSFADNTYYDACGKLKLNTSAHFDQGKGDTVFDAATATSWDAWKAASLDANSKIESKLPTGTWTSVRPNKYQNGRANVIIYNWDAKEAVEVDVAAAGLKEGDAFEIRDGQNFFGAPVVTGKFAGKSVKIPMKGLTIVEPVGKVPVAPVHTAPQFGIFVIVKK